MTSPRRVPIFATIIVLALFGFRWKRTQQMTNQYYWLYERTGPLTWRSKS